MSLVGQRIRKLRHVRHMTQEELAQQVGRPQQDISRFEMGAVRIPADLLPRFAHALQVPVSAFFEEDSETDTAVVSR